VKRIVSRDNALVKRLVRLAHSSRERRRDALALLDGPHLIAAFIATGRTAEIVALSDAGAADPEAHALALRCPAAERVQLADRLFAEISPVATPVGVLACAAVPEAGPLPARIDDAIVLDRLQEPGNVGSILRSAAAAGVATIIATPGTSFLWSPKVLRAAMGAHFSLRLHEGVALEAVFARRAGSVAATVAHGGTSLYTADLRGPIAWVFGNEGAGLDNAASAAADLRLRIPVARGTESLNVAAAAAVCLFEQVRQRAAR
jgi:RNA methyltransferase, TrmH family